MKGRALTKDLSMSELMAMRERGMTNRDIAEYLDVHVTTVSRVLGPQPAGMRASYRRKDKLPPLTAPKRDLESLEPLKRMSFAERCEQALGKPEEHGIKAAAEAALEPLLASPIDPFEPVARPAECVTAEKPADVARGAHKKEIAQINEAVRSHTPELIAVFGEEAVRTWLKVSLYFAGIPDCQPMNREKMLEVLKIMNAGGAPA